MDQHIALFYDDKKYLISSLRNFLQIGIEAGETAALLITEVKWFMLKAELLKVGFPIDQLIAAHKIKYVDAHEVLTALCPDSMIVSEESFNELIASKLGDLMLSPRTRWYGEIVSLLCDRGQSDVAVQLERYWNGFLARHSNVFLFCGYSVDAIEKVT